MGYDVIVVGGGPGGYVCAIRCAQHGLRTALVEEDGLGGVCLHRGCIPTKALYAATHLLAQAASSREIGLAYPPPEIDVAKLAAWKERVVSQLSEGVAALLDRNGVAVLGTRARLDGIGRVVLSSGDPIAAERIVLATGSSPIEIPGFPFDGERVWSSDDALALREIPERLVVIGGGVIGLELATIYRRLGSRVTVVELLPEILATVDLDRRTVATLRRALREQGIDVLVGTKAEGFERAEGGAHVRLVGGEILDSDRILVAVGRRPNSHGLGLDEARVSTDERGFVVVDRRLATTAEGVFAIGDLVPGPMLAHKASTEGAALADAFARAPSAGEIHIDYDGIPQAIFTDPEVASVGLSESSARAAGRRVVVGRFPYAALGKALGMRQPNGFFQLVADETDHRVLGAQIVGVEASDLISEAAVVVQSGLTLEAIADAVHPHPTLPEGLKEAADHALGRAIHTTNRS